MAGLLGMFLNSLDMSSAANDVIVIRQSNGHMKSTPFNVRFGKSSVIRPGDKVVQLEINGVMTSAVMKMGSGGEAFWLEPTATVDDGKEESPLASPTRSPLEESGAHEAPPITLDAPASVSSLGRSPLAKSPSPFLRQPTTGSDGAKSPAKARTPKFPASPDPSSGPVPAESLAQPMSLPPAEAGVDQVRSDGLTSPYDEGVSFADALAAEALTSQMKSENFDELLLSAQMAQREHEQCGDPSPASSTTEGKSLPTTPPIAPLHARVASAEGQKLTLSRLASIDQSLDLLAVAGTDAATQMTPPHPPQPDAAAFAALGEDYLSDETSETSVEDYYTETDDEGPRIGAEVHYKRTLTPLSSDLERLGLQEGINTVRYITHSSLYGRACIESRIFLWPSDAKIVVSDIDGTVTKSDVLGHLLTFIGRDWTHPGICSLYDKVARNGYQFVYLTARSVSQVESTRAFLRGVKQDGLTLPPGPVLTAPDKIWNALTQEVAKKSHEFKIMCLGGIKAAFPAHSKPFYAGFGNRIGDVIAYTASGIPRHKIFIIDPYSVVHVCHLKQSYSDLSHLVDETFVPRPAQVFVRQSWAPVPTVADRVATAEVFSTTPPLVQNSSAQAFLASDGQKSPADASGSGEASPSVMQSPDGSHSPVFTGSVSGFQQVSTPLVPEPQGKQGKQSVSGSKPTFQAKEEEVAVDQDFNTFNFWRVDPTTLVQDAPQSGTASATLSARSAPSTEGSRMSPALKHVHVDVGATDSFGSANNSIDSADAADPPLNASTPPPAGKEGSKWYHWFGGGKKNNANEASPSPSRILDSPAGPTAETPESVTTVES